MNKLLSHSSQQQNLHVTQLVQDFHPLVRRRAITSIRTSYPSFFISQAQSNLVPLNQSQRVIAQQYNRIHNIIDLVDQHIRRRIQCYQNQVVMVVQKEIDQMREQTSKVVEQFNSMIEQKNKENQIWSLNNQLDYFKSQAKKLYDSNKKMTKQNLSFKTQLKQYQWQLENRQIIMQKLLYKYQKQKYHKQKIKSRLSQNEKLFPNFKIKNESIKNKAIRYLKTENNQKSVKNLNNESILNINLSQNEQQSSIMSMNAQSIMISPELKDQGCQVNLGLLEPKPKINKKQTSYQTAIQTNPQPYDSQYQTQTIKRPNKVTKNGFCINEINSKSQQKTQSKRKLQSTLGRQSTEPNTLSKDKSHEIMLKTTDISKIALFKTKNKYYNKMVKRFQNHKVLNKAYSKDNITKHQIMH